MNLCTHTDLFKDKNENVKGAANPTGYQFFLVSHFCVTVWVNRTRLGKELEFSLRFTLEDIGEGSTSRILRGQLNLSSPNRMPAS